MVLRKWKMKHREIVDKKVCCYDIFVLKSIVGVRGFVICLEIGNLK